MINEKIVISAEDPILKNHKAFGQALMPGLAYIDLLYQLFLDAGYSFDALSLRKVAIYQPLKVGRGSDIRLSICCKEKSGFWEIVVEEESANNGEQPGRYLTAEMHHVQAANFEERLDIGSAFDASKPTLRMDEVYEFCRRQELVHSGFMKAEGVVYPGHDVLVRLAVAKDALDQAGDFLFHPTLLDGSANAAGVAIALERMSGTSVSNEPLSLPLYYESFRATEPLQRSCIARSKKASVEHKRELLSWDIEFFNESGKKMAELKRLTTKLVRDASAINPERQKESRPFANEANGSNETITTPVAYGGSYSAMAEDLLRAILASKLGIEPEEVGGDIGYYEMGLDSAMLLEVVKDLESALSISLAPTLLFEYTNVNELGAYLSDTYGPRFDSARNARVAKGVTAGQGPAGVAAGREQEKQKEETAKRDCTSDMDIAVIGLAGKYPGANTLAEFWNNLKEGKDCVTEIPKERWDWRVFDDIQSGSGRNISKWGGFIENPYHFDPQFFRVSPKEAKTLDPQERLFLEVCWEAIEDAGYTPRNITSSRGKFDRRDVGVFAGVMHKDYMMIGAEAVASGERIAVSLNHAAIANRVSFFCNFHGPSIVVDTACSSSMTAIHLAVESIHRGECQVALAGGVNLSLHKNKYMTYGMADMFSSDGYCHTFGEGGDGYVSGEGVGAVVLKPLKEAVADGDHIYAVIKGSAINHGGKVGGITVPSPVAQYDVIKKCFEKTGIDPRTISYVEAHGTGTSLGDPIEIQGLVRAFGHFTSDKNFCAIGSVKSNIGHAEAAAGISGISKVILQLHHKTLVPSLHSETTNPHIDLANSPFFVQHATEEWKHPQSVINGEPLSLPLRAGISSFGATGSNAHLILEEYVGEELRAFDSGATSLSTLFPVSAKNEERLQAYVSRLITFLKATANDAIDLPSVAYTLQVGREPMEERLIVIASERDELITKLQTFIDERELGEGVFKGPGKNGKMPPSFSAEDTQYMVERWISQGTPDKVAALWAHGFSIAWEELYHQERGVSPRRISLPTYPFEREQYVVESKGKKRGEDGVRSSTLHPLVHKNTSDFVRHRFSSVFSGDESFIKDCRIARKAVFPSIAYLEMARQAIRMSLSGSGADNSAIKLVDVVWTRPLAVDHSEDKELHIGLSQQENGSVFFEIYASATEASCDEVVLCQGEALTGIHSLAPRSQIDIAGILGALGGKEVIDEKTCHEMLAEQGIEFGQLYSGLERIVVGTNRQGRAEVIGQLSIASGTDARGAVATHPGVITTALKAIVGFGFVDGESERPRDDAAPLAVLPFAVGSAEITGDLAAAEWAWLRPADENSVCKGYGHRSARYFDLDIADADGHVVALMRGIAFADDSQNAFTSSAPKELSHKAVTRIQLCSGEAADGTPKAASTPRADKPDNIALANPDEVAGRTFGVGEAAKPDKIRLASTRPEATGNETEPLELFEHGDGIYCIRTARESQLSLLDDAVIRGLERCFRTVGERGDAKAVLLIGENDSFLGASSKGSVAEKELFLASRVAMLPVEFDVPVIAVMKGGGVGLGWMLASLCDFMICSETGTYGYLGHDPKWMWHEQESALFEERFGREFAATLVSGNHLGITAGAISKSHLGIPVVPEEDVESYALNLARRLASVPRHSLTLLKTHLSGSIRERAKHLFDAFAPASERGAIQPRGPVPERMSVFDDFQFSEDEVSVQERATVLLSESEGVRVEVQSGEIAVVTLCDRESKNSFTERMVRGITSAFDNIRGNTSLKVVIITGYDQYFSLGGTKEGLLAIQDGRAKYSDAPLYELPLSCEIPVIAAMQGHGIGAGWSLGMFCDLQIYSRESTYSTRFMQYGFTPGFGSTLVFPEKMGRDLAWEVLYTAREYKGEELKRRGIKQPVVPRAALKRYAIGMAEKLAELSREQLIGLKEASVTGIRARLVQVVDEEQAMHAKTFIGNHESLHRIAASYDDDVSRNQTVTEERRGEAEITAPGRSQPDSKLDEVTSFLRTALAKELDMRPEQVNDDKPFVELGLDSISGVTWIRKLNEHYGLTVAATKVYSYPTLTKFAKYVIQEGEKAGKFGVIVGPDATVSGADKCETKAAPAPNAGAGESGGAEEDLDAVRSLLRQTLANELDLNPEQIRDDKPFIELGLDSISGVTWIRKVNEKYGLSIAATKVYSHPSLAEFSRFVMQEGKEKGVFKQTGKPAQHVKYTEDSLAVRMPQKGDASERARRGRISAHCYYPTLASSMNRRRSLRGDGRKEAAIAVIGMSGQFPKAGDLREYWDNLVNGRDCISEIPSTRWNVDAYYDADPEAPGKTHCRWMGALDDVDKFDPLFFNISPREAELMDPQQRLFLQNAWHCIEEAGYDPTTLSGKKCGVFAGSAVGDYGKLAGEERLSLQGLMGDTSSILSARISYFLNLQGPCMSIDTACSSSLVAIATACDSLVAGASDLALAGGAYVMSTPEMHIMTSKSGMLSREGRCYTFDERANGFVPGEGVGVLLLKRLEDAEKDGDRIHGVIRGWGINQDGKTNGITAPNPESQARLEREVYEKFGINPEEIQLIEAHGTGTKLGDPIEIEGLKESFKAYTSKEGYCAIGSVKSNIGHLLTAAGVSGIIKLLLSIKNRVIPPTINYEKLNEHIEIDKSPFYIVTRASKWQVPAGTTRRAAVSSFGFSGTNAHVVVEEYRPARESTRSQGFDGAGERIIVLSARNAERLSAYAESLLAYIKESTDEMSLEDLAYTLQTGREAMGERLAIVINTKQQLIRKLQEFIERRTEIEDLFSSAEQGAGRGLSEIASKADVTTLREKSLRELASRWVQGVDFDWNELYGPTKPHRISAPVYPFQKKRFWLPMPDESRTAMAQRSNSLLGKRVNIAVDGLGFACFETTLPHVGGDYLRDYRFAGEIIVPPSVFVAMLSAAFQSAVDLGIETPVVLRDTRFHKALKLEKGDTRVQTIVRRDEMSDAWHANVLAWNEKSNVWELCASAKATVRREDFAVKTIEVDERQLAVEGVAKIYERSAKNGLVHGPLFMSLESLRADGEYGVAEIEIPDKIRDAQSMVFDIPHPVSIEPLFLVSSAMTWRSCKPGHVIIPESIRSISFSGFKGQKLVAKYRYAPGEEGGEHHFDFVLHDERGVPVAEILGLKSSQVALSEISSQVQESDSPVGYRPSVELGNLLSLSEHEVSSGIADGLGEILCAILKVDVRSEYENREAFSRTRFTAMGVDSLTTQEFCKRVRNWLGVEIPAEKIVGGGRVGDIVDFIQEQLLVQSMNSGQQDNDASDELDVMVL